MPGIRPRHFLIGGVAVLALTLVALFDVATVSAAWQALDPRPGSPVTVVEARQDADGTAAIDKDSAYIWSATRSGSTLRLRGQVPSEEDRRTVLGMVKAHFADLEVEDRLKVEEGGPPREQWLGAVSFGLKQLSHLKKGSARLLNAGIKVDGEARSGSDYAEVKKALAGPMPAGLTVLNDNVRPPFADPYIFSATLGPNALTLSGSVPNENVRKQLKDMSRQLFERPTLDDQLELASGAPKNWKDAVEASLRALSRLDSGKLTLSGVALTIEGLAPDKGTAVAVSYQLKRDLPTLFSSSESIKWKEADVSRNVGELIVPRIKEMIHSDNSLATGAIPADRLDPPSKGDRAPD
jgi:osmotically-inducible protein OsmY